MKPKLEDHSAAWNRAYRYRDSSRKTRWESDEQCPLRLRGYTELKFHNLDPKLRKKVDSGLKRGYMLEDRTQATCIMRIVERFNPIQRIRIGYLGKTYFWLFLPTKELAEELRQELDGFTVMSEQFTGKDIDVSEFSNGVYKVQYLPPRYNKESREDTTAMQSVFRDMRPLVDQKMAEWAAVREQIARWANDDELVIRIPFDSHKKGFKGVS